MSQFRKILAPVDLSEHSREGLLYAISVARENQAALDILHVADELQPWGLADDDAFISRRGALWEADRIVREARLELRRFLAKHREELGALPPAARIKILLGRPAEKILEFTSEERVDLIVMARRPLGTLNRWLFGSVTDRVAREAPCPVLSICAAEPTRPWRGRLVPSNLAAPPAERSALLKEIDWKLSARGFGC